MSVLNVLLVVIVCAVGALSAPPSDCPPCDRSTCAQPRNCAAGVVHDRCHCCRVCGLYEGEQCDIPGANSVCGHNMTCQALPEPSTLSKCVCTHDSELCGTDGQTYRNICHMKEVRATDGVKGLNVADKGPCRRKPHLVSGPEHVTNHTGGYVALSCEAEGYPIPTIEWVYTRADGLIRHLPGDKGEISVNLRGGPERHQITGWIQIMNLIKDHEGYYTCLALNAEGRTEGMASVLVRG